jgi:hypothetical protein
MSPFAQPIPKRLYIAAAAQSPRPESEREYASCGKAYEQFAALIIHKLNLGQTPAQCHRDDQNYSDRSESRT